MPRFSAAVRCLVSLTCLAVITSPAGAITSKYVEDFMTAEYRDPVNTTAAWDTVAGELRLPPFQLTRAGGLDTPGTALDVAVSGDYAYVADGTPGLQVISVANPASPTLAGSCNTPGYAACVAVSGDYAYVADRTSGLQVMNISDPASPTLVGGCDTPGWAFGVAVSGDYAYIADYGSGLHVVNISNPASPTVAGTYDTPGNAVDVTVDGDYAYVADDASGLQVIDVSNPASPTPAGSYGTAGNGYGAAVDGNYAYVADGAAGLQVIRAADAMSPMFVGSRDTPGYAVAVTVDGNYAYVADGTSGLQVVDVTNPASPTLAGSYNTPGYAACVAVSGDYAYVADGSTGLVVLNTTSPASPTLVGTCDTPGNAVGVAVSGAYAYVADYYSGLQVISLTNPASPTLVGGWGTAGFAEGVAVSGDRAYIAYELAGLQVVDISNPVSPTLAGSLNTPGNSQGVAVSGRYAYIADSGEGLQVIDISNPASPTLAGSCDTPGSAQSVAVSGDYAYVADASSGLTVISVANPATPAVVGSCATAGVAYGAAVSGDCAYIADAAQGLQVIEVLQRRFMIQANAGRSLFLVDGDGTILKVRLTAVQTDSIRWEVSADGGTSWVAIPPNNAWQPAGVAGTDLLWRSTHYCVNLNINPACSSLEVGWLYSHAAINAVEDIPDDQGGRVRLCMSRSACDFADASPPVATYNVWRRMEEASMLPHGPSSVPQRGPASFLVHTEYVGDLPTSVVDGRRILCNEDGRLSASFPPGTWEIVGSFAACQMNEYIYATTTLADSTEAGISYAVYCVSAHTTTPSVWYVGPPDSGYSVDNLAPAPPGSLRMISPTALAWDGSNDEDFKYFTAYGSSTPGLDSTASLIGYTISTTMDVTGGVYAYYHVTATDFAGNEGDASSVENAYSGVNTVGDIPAAFALEQSRPNPFSLKTSIAFDMPVGCAVSLSVFDAEGRQVKALAESVYPAGRHSVIWAGDDGVGRPVSSGIYFVRLEAGDFKATAKALLTR